MTPFGEMARRLRREQRLLLGDMATQMGITAAFASQVETGAKRIPDGYVEKMIPILQLNQKEAQKLHDAALISAPTFTLRCGKNSSELDRELARNLEIGFARLDERRKRRLLSDLKGVVDG